MYIFSLNAHLFWYNRLFSSYFNITTKLFENLTSWQSKARKIYNWMWCCAQKGKIRDNGIDGERQKSAW